MVDYNSITENAFRFIKNRCKHCDIVIRAGKNFCGTKCKLSYFREIKIKNWTNKKIQSKHHVFELSDILSEENLKAMVNQTISRIDKKTN